MSPLSVIDVVKALLIGCGGAVAYYCMVSYIFRMVVYPAYRKVADFLIYESVKRETRTKTERYLNLLRSLRSLLGGLMALTWWAMFGGYAYILYRIVAYYYELGNPAFWWLYGIGLALPIIWVVWHFIGFFRKPVPMFVDWKPDTRPLLEQMMDD